VNLLLREKRSPYMSSRILPKNEHPLERIVRVVLGLSVLAMAFVGPQTPWGYLGIIPLLTGIVGSCPLYTLFGFSTCPVDSTQKP
jgi:hypothetical protein